MSVYVSVGVRVQAHVQVAPCLFVSMYVSVGVRVYASFPDGTLPTAPASVRPRSRPPRTPRPYLDTGELAMNLDFLRDVDVY